MCPTYVSSFLQVLERMMFDTWGYGDAPTHRWSPNYFCWLWPHRNPRPGGTSTILQRRSAEWAPWLGCVGLSLAVSDPLGLLLHRCVRVWVLQLPSLTDEMGSKKKWPVRPCRKRPLNWARTSQAGLCPCVGVVLPSLSTGRTKGPHRGCTAGVCSRCAGK